jgi:flagellar hook-length control protein FliK
MDFAADAVFDAIAPPPRAGAPRAAPSVPSEPSFADHLDAATAETPAPERPPETTASETPAAQTQPAENESAEPVQNTATPETGAETADATPAEAPAPAFMVQVVATPAIVASAGSATAPTADAAQPAAAPTIPAAAPQAAPSEPAPPSPHGAQQGAEAPMSAQSGKSASGEQKHAAPSAPANTGAPAPQPDADTNAAAPATQSAQPTPATPVTMPTATADGAVVTTTAAAAAPAAQPREHAARSGKNESNAGKAPTDAAQAAGPANPTVAQRAATNSAPAQQAAKETIAAAAPTLDAPEAPAPAPTNAASTASTQASSHTQHAVLDQAARAPASAQVAREIVRHFNGESTSFELRLDPPELGRVEVRLEVTRDHRVTAVIAADSPQALTELARNARELEQMLQSAGLELSDSGLSFDLRQGHEQASNAQAHAGASGAAGGVDETLQTQTTARPIGYERWRGVRVDMMV